MTPLHHLDLSDDAVAKDIMAEKARELIAAYERIEDLQNALRGLIGLVQLLSHNTDIPAALRENMLIHHRVLDAQEILR